MTLPSLPLPEDLPDAEESVGLSSLPMLNSVPASEVTELVGVCSDPAFPYHRADGEPYCYSSATYAAHNGGPCQSWCSLNPRFTRDNAPSVCGPVSSKLCWGSADIMTLPSLPLPEDLPDAEESVGLSSLPTLNSVPASEVTELVGVCSD